MRHRLDRCTLRRQQSCNYPLFELLSVSRHVRLPAPPGPSSYPCDNYSDTGGSRTVSEPDFPGGRSDTSPRSLICFSITRASLVSYGRDAPLGGGRTTITS